jgi:hypothetical protein
MSRRLLVFLLVLALPLTLAACGGDDSSEDEDAVTEVIETSVKSTDPADCTTLQTQQFVEQTTLETGKAAITQCEEDAADTTDDPDSVEISNLEVDGSDATADVAFTGGPFDGSTVSVALVKEGDQWKMDEITDIPEFNFESFIQAFEDQAAAEGELPGEVATCIVDAFNTAGAEEVKAIIVEGDAEGLNALVVPCVPGAEGG